MIDENGDTASEAHDVLVNEMYNHRRDCPHCSPRCPCCGRPCPRPWVEPRPYISPPPDYAPVGYPPQVTWVTS